jgi:hypothetical protein
MRSVQVLPNVSPTADRVLCLVDGPRPELGGRRLRLRGLSAVYLVDPSGFVRRIPSQTVYGRLFCDPHGREDMAYVGDIASRPPLAASTMLVRGCASNVIYLLDQGRKRPVAGPAAMAKYSFDRDRVCVVRQVLIDSIPCGVEWA